MLVSFVLLAAGLAHGAWAETLARFVTPGARVNYSALAKEGMGPLNAYLDSIGSPWPAGMPAAEKKAAMINAYNALTVRWVAGHFPIPSIWRTRHPFTEARHKVDGRMLSLDQLETQLRAMGDPRIHAALVCAARSCPPLRREPYEASKLDAQLDDNTRRWLADTALNAFDTARREAEVSQIFEWYAGDFGNVAAFLAQYGPAHASFLRDGGGKIRYRDYYWGLNDNGAAGGSYFVGTYYYDYFRNKFF